MKKRVLAVLLTLLTVWLLTPAAALAGPAYPGEIEVIDGSGQTLTIKQYGDEFFSYISDLNGNLLYYNKYNGGYYYVEYDGADFIIGERVGVRSFWNWRRTPRPRVNVSGADADFREKLMALRAEGAPRPFLLGAAGDPPPVPDNYTIQASDPLYGKLIADNQNVNAPEKTKTCPLLVLKVDFADIKCQFSDAQWNKRIFLDGVSSYYTEVSNGKFTYVPVPESYGTQNDGVITVTLPLNRPNFAEGSGGGNTEKRNYGMGAKMGLYTGKDGTTKFPFYSDTSLYAYGLAYADNYIDFSLYDRNGDNYISPTELAVLVVAAGYEASCSGRPEGSPMSWAHSWSVNSLRWNESATKVVGELQAVKLDGKKLYSYTIMGENMNGSFKYATNESQSEEPEQMGFGGACHELAHDLGLRDLYATGGPAQERDVSGLSLMAGGSWGSTPESGLGNMPTHLDPYSKIWLGFYEAETASEPGVYPAAEASDSENYNILRVDTDDPDVYYLVENRTFTGFDAGLYDAFDEPGGAVYWRINEAVVAANWWSNSINNQPGNYGVMPVYPHYDPNEYRGCIPFRNNETYDAYEKVHTVVANPETTLVCYDETAPSMNVWLNMPVENPGAIFPLTISPGGSFTRQRAPGDITLTLGAGTSITLDDLQDVRMDGETLHSPEQYEGGTGSIIITLKRDYLNTLMPGNHILRITLRSGQYAETVITVTEPVEIPNTGDSALPVLWLCAALAAGVGLLVRRKRRGRVF